MQAKNYRKMFSEMSLIYAPPLRSGGNPRWVRKGQCLWKGDKCFHRFVPLRDIYPGNRKLFRDVLGIADAGVGDLVREAENVRPGDDLPHLREIFLKVEEYLESDGSSNSFMALRQLKLFPICTGDEDPGTYGVLEWSDSAFEWFIADRVHLLESFKGLVPLLALSVEDIEKLPLSLRTLGVEKRRLTKSATSVPSTRGPTVPDPFHTQSFRAKAEFILR
jgi:hypothetical protein